MNNAQDTSAARCPLYTFTQQMNGDAQALHRAALAHFLEGGGSEELARGFLLDDSEKPDVEACIVELLDRSIDGCTIIDSGAERAAL